MFSIFFYLKDNCSSIKTDEEEECSDKGNDLPSYLHLQSVKENYQNIYGEENCWKDSINESITKTVPKMQSREEDMKVWFEEILKVESAALDFKKELEERQKVSGGYLIQGSTCLTFLLFYASKSFHPEIIFLSYFSYFPFLISVTMFCCFSVCIYKSSSSVKVSIPKLLFDQNMFVLGNPWCVFGDSLVCNPC